MSSQGWRKKQFESSKYMNSCILEDEILGSSPLGLEMAFIESAYLAV